MITLTDKAIEKIKEISVSEDIGHFNLRVKVQGGGCSGFVHDLFFEDIISDLDEIVEIDGVKLVVDPLSYQYLQNVNIDYQEKDFGAGFKFTSPDITKTCGCGNSASYT